MAAISKYLLLRKKIILLTILRRRILSKKNMKKQKCMWVRRIFDERQQKGLFNILIKDLRQN